MDTQKDKEGSSIKLKGEEDYRQKKHSTLQLVLRTLSAGVPVEHLGGETQ